MKRKVFVYGSLRQGASNAWRMKKARLMGQAKVKGTLVKITWYPGLVLGGENWVQGEVYEVDDDLLVELDAFEGIHPDGSDNGEYRRLNYEVQLETGSLLYCEVYEWQLGIVDYETIASGDWLSPTTDFCE